MFFAPRNKETALGMYTPLYFIALAVCIILIIVGLILSRKMNKKQVYKTLVIIGIFLWITEIIKMIFYFVTYGLEDVDFIPLYFCSMYMYASALIMFKNEKLKNTGLSFMFFGGIIGAIVFFCYPSACVPNYPLFHYMTLRTFIYHSLMIYAGFLIVITGYYQPNVKHFVHYSIFLGITFILAYILNIVLEDNLMYIMKPIKIAISQNAYNWNPTLYPFIVGILEIVGPFWATYFIYWLVMKIKNINKKVENV